MSDYSKITDFAAKDSMLTGNPLKEITGTAHDNEYNAIAVAVATKHDSTDIGVTVQAYDAFLTSIATLGTAADKMIYTTAANTAAEAAITAAGRALLDDADAATMRATLGAAALAGSASQAFSASNFTTAQGISFPATQNPSSDPNTLDDYEEGDWTPAITFDTPGNLSVAYSTALGRYTKIGRKVSLTYALATSSFIHTTASGSLKVTGIPFACSNNQDAGAGSLASSGGITKAGYTMFTPTCVAGNTFVNITAMASAIGSSSVTAADMPSGGTVFLIGTIEYFV